MPRIFRDILLNDGDSSNYFELSVYTIGAPRHAVPGDGLARSSHRPLEDSAMTPTTMLEAERQSMASQANGKNACCLKQELAARNGLDKSDRMHANFVEISIPTYSIYVYLSI